MIYGLSGASATGKSTLGKAVAEYLDITFLPTSITECARKHGYEAVSQLSLARRLDLQWHLLNDHVEALQKTKRPAITDRTPVDMIAYLMGEFWMTSDAHCTPQVMQGAEHYVNECLRAAQAHYDYLFHLARLPLYEVRDGRPAVNPAYQRHTDLIMKGALIDLNGKVPHTVIASETLDWRVDTVAGIIADRLNMLEFFRKSTRHLN